jgi:integrase
VQFQLRDLRPTAGKRIYLANGKNARAAANVLRHESEDMTFRHYIGATEAERIAELDAVFGPEVRSQ